MTAVDQYAQALCSWCRTSNPAGTGSCSACGAPLDGVPLETVAGWRAYLVDRNVTSQLAWD